jgi:hypothetical protein
MGMNPLYVKVHIPKPCKENWDDMLPAEQGRFCLNCQKTVVDFTQKSDAEILDYLSRTSNLCGRFYTHQVLQPYELPRTFWQKWKDFVAAASLVIGTKLAVITPSLAQTQALRPKVQTIQHEIQQPVSIVAPDGNIYLKGTLLAKEDEKPLAGAKVSVQAVNQLDEDVRLYYGHTPNSRFPNTAFQTVTDSAGEFELVVPVVELGKNTHVVNFNFAGNNSYASLDAFRPGHALVQYLPRTEFKPVPDISRYETRMGDIAGERFITTSVRRKYYRTRAGVVLTKAAYPFRWLAYPVRWITYPYRWVKNTIEEKSYYD